VQAPSITHVIVRVNENCLLHYDYLIAGFNHHLGVKGVLKRVNTEAVPTKWIWRAAERQTLKWTGPVLGSNLNMF
jgi:hypothetical protein